MYIQSSINEDTNLGRFRRNYFKIHFKIHFKILKQQFVDNEFSISRSTHSKVFANFITVSLKMKETNID